MRNKILYIVFFVFTSLVSEGQYYNLNFKGYKVKDGLTADDIQCLYTDSEGYLWIGTRFGLSKFDGQRFRNFYFDPKNKSSLGGSHVLDITEDKVGNIWVAIENFGLSKLDKISHEFENFQIPYKDKIEERYINTVHIDFSGKIWVGTETAIFQFDPITKKYSKVAVKSKTQNPDIISILSDDQGNMWAATYEGEIIFKKKEEIFFSALKINQEIGIINQLYYDDGKQILIASEHGLFELQINVSLEKSVLQPASFYKSSEDISRIFKDPDGNMWIANRNRGLQIYFPGSKYLQHLNISRMSALDPGISCWKSFNLDKEGGIWIGGELGLFQFNNKSNQFSIYNAIEKYNKQNTLGNVVGIDGFENHIITVCTEGLSVYKKTENDFVAIEIDKGLVSSKLIYNSIVEVDKGTWWLSTNLGILELKHGLKSFTLKYAKQFLNHPQLSNCEVYNISSNHDGNFWIATPLNGLFLYNLNSGKFKVFENAYTFKYSKDLKHTDYAAVSNGGDVVVGYHYGLALKKKESDVFIPVQSLIDTDLDWTAISVYDICESSGYWWLATEGHGLWRLDFNQRKVVVYAMSDGLLSNSIMSILPSNDGKIIAATSRGLSLFDIKTTQFKNFINQDGLISEQFIRQAKFKNSDGEYFFSTTDGVISFFPDKIKHTVRVPSIKLNSILIDNNFFTDSALNSFGQSKEIKINYNERLVMVFSPHILSGQSNYQLRFKLSDDDEWHETKSGTNLYLLNIDPGSYHVTAQFIETRGAGMSQYFTFNLEVVPPFWKTTIFFLSILLLIPILVWVYLNRIYQIKLKTQKMEASIKSQIDKERMRIAMELHDDIGGNLTALSLMGSILKEKDISNGAHGLVDKMIEASDQMVDDMNEIVWALNTSNDTLKSTMGYIKQNVSTLLSNAGIKLEVNEPIDYQNRFISGQVRRNIFLIIKEICNNIVKHANTQKVEMVISVNDSLEIIISDNGVGIQDLDLEKSQGMGQHNLKERALEIGAKLLIKHEKGHTINLSMPLSKIIDES